MDKSFNFKNLFVLDLANNHQGSLEHGLAAIRAHAQVVRSNGVRAALKFQFRQLDTFIHPSQRENTDNKHISRFQSTRLEPMDYKKMLDCVRAQGMLSMCTPFDEESVDLIEDMGFDLIKLASCSAKDWPLIERIAASAKPTVFSTGGLEMTDIDNLVSFFTHRGLDFALMHCVSLYPTPAEHCQLNQIEQLRRRHPMLTVGWSTHEQPDDTDPVFVAYAKGARMFERHVGLATDKVKLNAYSSTPEQVERWLTAWKKAVALCGDDARPPAQADEIASIDSLQRGVWMLEAVKKGEEIPRQAVRFAMPLMPGQVPSGSWKENIVATRDLEPGIPLPADGVSVRHSAAHGIIKKAIHDVKAMLNIAGIPLSAEFSVEYSHHYGPLRFREVGAVLITCINRQYCKKLIVQLPGQHHPKHFHKLKEEAFQVLHGELHLEVDGKHRVLAPGDIQVVLPGVWHNFWTESGVIFEEISTTQYENDSVYFDPQINRLTASQRKTSVDHWGRYQLTEHVAG